jgi:hypothetical protein
MPVLTKHKYFEFNSVSDKVKKLMNQYLNPLQCVVDFYSLVLAQKYFNPFTTPASSMKFFDEAWARVANPLAAAFRDYCAIECWDELLHARYACEVYYPSALHKSQRLSCTPESILKATYDIFEKNWEDDESYGGSSWLEIAKAGLMYNKVPDTVFIDHCVDLSHNDGLFLDKHSIFTNEFNDDLYMDFLSIKSKGNVKQIYEFLTENYWEGDLVLSQDLKPIWAKMIMTNVKHLHFVEPWYYEPIPWGNQVFIETLIQSESKEE